MQKWADQTFHKLQVFNTLECRCTQTTAVLNEDVSDCFSKGLFSVTKTETDRKRLAIQLQRCNASVLLRKISNLLQDDTSDPTDL